MTLPMTLRRLIALAAAAIAALAAAAVFAVVLVARSHHTPEVTGKFRECAYAPTMPTCPPAVDGTRAQVYVYWLSLSDGRDVDVSPAVWDSEQVGDSYGGDQ